ncbi:MULTISPECIES: ATP-grasp domain-containing protein [Enorma]|uniref:ATP-grasp domain-containing protein n=1 Tax=Enorma phocaeensis TaxID=1871019 RepID=A0A921IUM9_9ACTN|nr:MULTISPECIES: ATP-grasp domain-containing protein [Enorma]HJG37659.1 ATP-grasp domain-containing protein [Enorma phocaeensis]
MKSILLLGGSRQQVVAIETAKRLGYRTVLCDYLVDNPGQYAADVYYGESTTDREAVFRIAQAEQVSGVLAYASDPAALSAAFVAEKMNLPGNPLQSVEVLSTKHLFRSFLAGHGFNCPRTLSFNSSCTAGDLLAACRDMTFPVVVKPTDSSGSKGVSVIDEASEVTFAKALEYAKAFSRNGVILVEEYIRSSFPRVIGGDVFVVDGRIAFWGLMSCLRDSSGGGLVPIGERYPSGASDLQLEAIKRELSRLVSELHIAFGEFNVEVIIGDGGKPYVLEFGARAGGNMIPIQLSDVSGIDLVEANVRFAMGDYSQPVTFSGNGGAYATYVLHAQKSGVLRDVLISDSIAPKVYRRVMYRNIGEPVESFVGANNAIGIVFMRFESVMQMERDLQSIGNQIRVVISE